MRRRAHVPVAGSLRCWCPCHRDETSQALVINGVIAPGVPRTDPVETVQACRRCIGAHALVFSGRPPEPGYTPQPKVPEPPRGAWQQDATGTTYHFGGGDGDEG